MSRTNTEIQNELESLSPLLASIPFDQSFQISDHYFDNLAGEIFEKIKYSEITEANMLESLPKLQPLTVSQDYFQNNPSIIIEAIKLENNHVKRLSIKTIYRFAAAAVVTGLLGWGISSYIFRNKTTEKQTASISQTDIQQQWNGLSENEVIAYLEDSGCDVNAALVASLSDESTLPTPEEWLSNDQLSKQFFAELKCP